ncbi:MAG: hypothetical protein Crog4KO_05560 [Crocinitomicaceae bacterium]
MKIVLVACLLFASAFTVCAEDVDLKITYKGDGLSGHTVTIMLGNTELGSGVTDSGGEVSISVSALPSKSIDLKGEKTCDGARKSWSASGYVTLDGSNFAHLKMEDLVAEMVEASGGMMSESMLVASYGLVCSGSSTSAKESSGGSNSGNEEAGSSEESAESNLMTKEEMQANQKAGLENKIASLENKMEKKQSKIDEGKLTGDKKSEGEQKIREWDIEKQIAQNKLDKLNLQMEKGLLNKTERKSFKEKEDALKDELKAVKSGKGAEVSNEATESAEEAAEDVEEAVSAEVEENEFVVTEADLANMSNNDLKKAKIGLKSDLGKIKLKLKTRKNALSPKEIEELEADIVTIEKSIEVIEAEQDIR